MTDYPAIERKAEIARLATVGKRGHQKALKKMRTASLVRELRRFGPVRRPVSRPSISEASAR